LGDGRQHMEPQTAAGVAGIDILIQYLPTCLPWSLSAFGTDAKSGHHQGVPWPNIFQTGL
jgi:hypothetical protein